MTRTLILATRNTHKTREIRAVLGEDMRCLTLADFPNAPVVKEDAPTFAGNAAKKAVRFAEWLADARAAGASVTPPLDLAGAFVLADDSGLEVDALSGAPGVYSARFAASETGAAGNSTDEANNAKLLRLLANVPSAKRTARFRCVLALAPVVAAEPAGSSPVCYSSEAELRAELFDGACEGAIDLCPRGSGGFGYDPLFIPNGYHQSFAELGDDFKNQFSHRARALAKLGLRFAGIPK